MFFVRVFFAILFESHLLLKLDTISILYTLLVIFVLFDALLFFSSTIFFFASNIELLCLNCFLKETKKESDPLLLYNHIVSSSFFTLGHEDFFYLLL